MGRACYCPEKTFQIKGRRGTFLQVRDSHEAGRKTSRGGRDVAPGTVSGSVSRGDRHAPWASDPEAGAQGCQREHQSLE